MINASLNIRAGRQTQKKSILKAVKACLTTHLDEPFGQGTGRNTTFLKLISINF
jgi:hypothetical protein